MTSIEWPDFTETLAAELASMPEGRTLTLAVSGFHELHTRIQRDQEGLSAEFVSLRSPEAALHFAWLSFRSPRPRITHEACEQVLRDLGWREPDPAHDDQWWAGPLLPGRSSELARMICSGLSEALRLEAPRMLVYYARDEAAANQSATMRGLGIYRTDPPGSPSTPPSTPQPQPPGLSVRAPLDDAARARSRRRAWTEPWSRLLGFVGTAFVIIGCVGLMVACATALDDDGTGPKCGYTEMGPGDVCESWVSNEYTGESTYEEMVEAYESAPQRRASGAAVSGGLVALGITMNVVNGRIKRRLSI